MPSHDHCCVFACSSRRDKRPDLSFHSFPQKEEVKQKWIQAIKRVEDGEHFAVTKNTVVCSEHFDSRCFYPREESCDDAGKKKKTCARLKPSSCPTTFSFREETVERPSPESRRAVASVRSTQYEEALEAKKLCRKRGESVLEFEQRLELEELRAKVKEQDADIDRLKLEVAHLGTQLFSFENVKNNPAGQLEFLTGLTPTVWKAVWDFLEPSHANVLSARAAAKESSGRVIQQGSGRKSPLSLDDQMFMLMVRLRLGRLQEELAYMFAVDPGTVSRILNTWINYVYLRLGMIPIWPSWDDVKKSMPPAFQRRYPNTFIIIDATELRVEKPSTLSLQSQLYSPYKSHCTVKGLVGITPNGMFTFISQLYTGAISDRQLVIDSGILPLRETVPPGKIVMADRGFPIQDLLVKPNLVLNLPPF